MHDDMFNPTDIPRIKATIVKIQDDKERQKNGRILEQKAMQLLGQGMTISAMRVPELGLLLKLHEVENPRAGKVE